MTIGHSPVPRHASPVTRHASPVTRHASRVTRHASPVTRHDSLLLSLGLESVSVSSRNDTLFLSFENRRYRWEVTAVAEALNTVMPLTGDSTVVNLTLLRTGIPVVTITVPKRVYGELIAGTMSEATFEKEITVTLAQSRAKDAAMNVSRPLNPAYRKADFSVAPLLKLQLGNFDNPLEAMFALVPGMQMTLARGTSLTAQVIVPVFNNLTPEAGKVRPGIVTLSQTIRLPHHFYTTLSAGYFTNDQYGFSGEVKKYLFNARVSAGAIIGYTGTAGWVQDTWLYTGLSTVTWSANASWRWAKQDLTLRASYGRYIYGDQGIRVDAVRRFGEVSVGFWAIRSGGVTNGGFNFVIPLPPRRYPSKHRVRLRPASYVPWEYRAFGLPHQGKTYHTGSEIETLMFNLNPDYLRTHLGSEILKKKPET